MAAHLSSHAGTNELLFGPIDLAFGPTPRRSRTPLNSTAIKSQDCWANGQDTLFGFATDYRRVAVIRSINSGCLELHGWPQHSQSWRGRGAPNGQRNKPDRHRGQIIVRPGGEVYWIGQLHRRFHGRGGIVDKVLGSRCYPTVPGDLRPNIKIPESRQNLYVISLTVRISSTLENSLQYPSVEPARHWPGWHQQFPGVLCEPAARRQNNSRRG